MTNNLYSPVPQSIRFITEALTAPIGADRWLTRVAIGGVLTLGSVFIVPLFVLAGYMIRVVRAGSSGSAPLPPFTNPVGLILDGIRWAVISAIFIAIPTVVGAIGTVVAARAFVELSIEMATLVLIGVILLTTVTFFIAIYLLPIAIINLSRSGTLAGAFDRPRTKDIAMCREFPPVWAAWFGLLVIGGVVSGMLSVLVVGIFVYFYIMTASHYLLGNRTTGF